MYSLSTVFKNNIMTQGKRFFSSLPDTLVNSNFKTFRAEPDPLKVQELVEQQKKMTDRMEKQYPGVLRGRFTPGRIVYRLCTTSPEEMIHAGGFQTKDNIFVARHSETGLNRGSICFSLLPEVAAVFYDQLPSQPKKYIYACVLEHYFAPGGKWRQVIVPGAFPVPAIWIAREVTGLTVQRELTLGAMVGQIDSQKKLLWGEHFKNFTLSHLTMPQILDYGNEDQSMEFDIIDCPQSREFQQQVERYYKCEPLSWPVSPSVS
ncbi:hypothetical protein Lbir_2698 [Legionella birminghamensis]|uniref:Uncharacterized protein n=1 Tax=Legionella birminghamensis TaxID=28083 RepID=A0A378IG62_9GAMM|nr:hypothetical protein [Legionella birminghamensis]KTC68096.1 hypothetical protein Lbir_2698 [Legionella birminghamensis]STX31194.1 Uncharacterised protein [Legionella birminghamensis]